MRCPTCGTENAPDSRFCGGCGARLTASQGVAPTQKISDEAGFPQPPVGPAPGHAAHVLARAETPRVVPMPAPYAPVGSAVAPASAPEPPRALSSPPMRAPEPPRAISSPPAAYAHPPAVSVPSPGPPPGPPSGSVGFAQLRPRTAQAIDDPALSMPIVARRPWRLIIVVLMIDIGLVIAGGWMLSAGLGDQPRAGSAAPRPGPLPSESK